MAKLGRVRHTGDLCLLGSQTEQTYGTASGNASYWGHLTTLADNTSWEQIDVVICGNVMPKKINTVQKSGYNASFRPMEGSAFTSVCSVAKSKGSQSFSLSARVDNANARAWSGAVIENFTLTATVGSPVEIQISGMARNYAQDTWSFSENVVADSTEGVSVKLPSAPTTLTPVIFNSASIGGSKISARSVSVTITNEYANIPGVQDGKSYGTFSNEMPSLVNKEIMAELVVPSGLADDAWEEGAELTGTVVLNFGLNSITLSDCSVEPFNTSRTSTGAYDDTLRIRATSMDVA